VEADKGDVISDPKICIPLRLTTIAAMDALQPSIDKIQDFCGPFIRLSAQKLIYSLVKTSPWWLSALLALGSFGAGRFAYQTLSVLLQTFILPGTSVCSEAFKQVAITDHLCS
jgi:hypothetical protein